MAAPESIVETAYRERIDAMTPAERVARSAAMFQWMKDQIARQIAAERPEESLETLKWLVALRLYGDDPALHRIIEQKLTDVSR